MPEAPYNDADAIVQSAVDCIIIADYAGRIVEFNPAAEKVFGYKRDEVLGRDIAETIVPPALRDAHRRGTERFRSTGEAHLIGKHVEMSGLRSDGTEFPLELALTTITFRESPACVAYLRDISARKNAERRLAAQYAATRALAVSNTLAEAAPRILEAICESLGWSVAILWELDRRDRVLVARTAWQASAATSEFVNASQQTSLPSGIGLPGRVSECAEPVWIVDVQTDTNFPRTAFAHRAGLRAAFAFPVLSDAGVLGVMEFFSTVSHPPDEDLLKMLAAIGSQMGQFIERKRNEEEHRQSEERTRRIVDTSLEAVVTMDSQGLITGWNPQAEITFGWSRTEVIGRRMSETIIPQRYREAHDRGLQRFVATETGTLVNKRVEITALRRNQEEFPIELAICPLKLENGWAFSAFIRDITERKQNEIDRKNAQEALQRSYEELDLRVQQRTEDLRKAKESAERASRAKSEFLTNISHEIRTPLNGVIGMTSLLLQENLGPVEKDYAATIKMSGEALLAILSDILDFSKIEAGRFELEAIDFDPRAVLEDALELVAENAYRKHLELTLEVDPEFPAQVLGDPARLRQIVLNLLANAVKFTDEGEVKLRARQQVAASGDLEVYVEVCDTGIGIAEDVQKCLFESFTQADSSTTRKYGGAGLGLAISRQLVERMGGRIGVISASGHGSTFWFTARLPMTRKAPSVSEFSGGLEGCRVLIVDDHDTNRRVLCTQIRQWHMRPETVNDGPSALRALLSAHESGQPFSLAVLDFMMPGMDGLMLTEAIRSDAALSSLPIVLLTSVSNVGVPAKAKSLGVAACVMKPVRQAHLLRTICLALHCDRAQAPDALAPAYS